MDDLMGAIIFIALGLLGLNNAIFPGLPKENRWMLGIIGVIALGTGVFVLMTGG